jgi:hypothetical protein
MRLSIFRELYHNNHIIISYLREYQKECTDRGSRNLREVEFPRLEASREIKCEIDPDETCIRNNRDKTGVHNVRILFIIIVFYDNPLDTCVDRSLIIGKFCKE